MPLDDDFHRTTIRIASLQCGCRIQSNETLFVVLTSAKGLTASVLGIRTFEVHGEKLELLSSARTNHRSANTGTPTTLHRHDQLRLRYPATNSY